MKIQLSRVLLGGLIAVAPVLSACNNVLANGSPTPVPSRQFIVAIDISGSRPEAALEDSKRTLSKIVQSLRPGDLVTLVRVASQGRQPGNTQTFDIPPVKNTNAVTANEQQLIEDTRDDINRAMTRLLAKAPSIRNDGTDILATLFTVADQIREPRSETNLVLLSDMIQDSPGVRFQHPEEIPSALWLERVSTQERLPNLRGVCASAVGPDPSTPTGARIREFWLKYFDKAGARLDKEHYRQTSPDAAILACR